MINLFVKGIFAYRGNVFQTKEKEESEEESEEESDENKFFKDINNKSEGVKYELFEKHFKFAVPTIMAKTLFETKNKKRNSVLVNVINRGLCDLEDQIKKMFKYEKKKLEQPDKILKIVEKFFEFNKKVQSGEGLKI